MSQDREVRNATVKSQTFNLKVEFETRHYPEMKSACELLHIEFPLGESAVGGSPFILDNHGQPVADYRNQPALTYDLAYELAKAIKAHFPWGRQPGDSLGRQLSEWSFKGIQGVTSQGQSLLVVSLARAIPYPPAGDSDGLNPDMWWRR